jgi:N-acetylglucosamine-6-phosphate deacetylase
MTRILYQPTTVFTGNDMLANHSVLVENHTITAIIGPEDPQPIADTVVDLEGQLLAPGLIDIQVYGGGGALFSSTPTLATLENLYEHCKRHQTTGFCATLPTNPPDMMHEAIEAARAFQRTYPDVLFGLHLEGPFLSPAKRGAHPAEYMLEPTLDNLRYWLEAGQGVLRVMTIAPELCTPDAWALARQYGVVLSAGHSDASFEQATAAFEAGCDTVTHFFNAMSQWNSRTPGLVAATLEHPTVRASIIADGVHVAWPSVRLAKRIMGERLFLITDAVDDSGSGTYQFFRKDDHYVNADGVLGGSALTMPRAVELCVEMGVCTLPEALRMASRYPAEVLGMADQYGSIAVGYRADFAII